MRCRGMTRASSAGQTAAGPARARRAGRGVPGGAIHVGIGGWTYAPWRGEFYPAGLPHARELEHASRRVTSIEVNGTFYRTQRPATFAKWAREVPDGFVFSLKGPRAATQRAVLAEAGPSIERFLDSGPAMLGDRLGPMLWQLPPARRFDEADLGRFLELLPRRLGEHRLRHALEVRHASFKVPAFVGLARAHGVCIVYAEHASYPAIADLTADFVYARLQRGQDGLRQGYPSAALDAWAGRFRMWAAGGMPPDLGAMVAPDHVPPRIARDVLAYVIHEGKLRAPAAAEALLARLAPA